VPMFSGVLSCVWALGLVPLLGLNLDPLILVVPVFLSARALSHSVQSMDRYHEEYHRTQDRHTAIVESYSHLFPPAIVSILNDAAGLFLVTMAPIPIIQKVALFSCFWIFSILISVVTLHPIILSATKPPGAPSEWPKWAQNVGWAVLAVLGLAFGGVSLYAAYDLLGLLTLSIMLVLMAALYRWHESIYKGLTDLIITATVTKISAGTLTNVANVAPPVGTTDNDLSNNSASDTDTVQPVADLSITKTDGVSSLNLGATTVYTVVVTNLGPSEVTGATISDPAPTGLTIVSWTCSVFAQTWHESRKILDHHGSSRI